MKKLPLKDTSYQILLQDFTDWLDVLGFSESIQRNTSSHVREFLHWLEKKEIINIQLITIEHINRYYNYLKRRKNQTKDGALGVASLNKHQHALRKFKEYLNKHGNKTFKVHLDVEKELDVNEIEILTKEEVKGLFHSVHQPEIPIHFIKRDLALLVMLYSCGLRRSEVVKLDRKDVLYLEKRITIRNTKTGRDRYVPINNYNLQILQEYILDFRYQFAETITTEAVFVNYRGNRLQGKSISNRLESMLKRTNNQELIAKGITPHKLRHSIATHLLQSGVEIEKIAQFLGHGSLESTQIYTHIVRKIERNGIS